MAHEFLSHEALLRRQPSIDQLCAGLESLGMLNLIRCMPETFKGVFTFQPGFMTAEKVVSMLKFPGSKEVEVTAAKFLVDVLNQATDEGRYYVPVVRLYGW